MSKYVEAGVAGFKDSFRLLVMIFVSIAATVIAFANHERAPAEKQDTRS